MEKENQEKNLIDLEEMIDNCCEKIAFIEDFFTHGHEPDVDWFSEDGRLGFYHILVALQDDLKFVSNELGEKRQKGLIVEAKAS